MFEIGRELQALFSRECGVELRLLIATSGTVPTVAQWFRANSSIKLGEHCVHLLNRVSHIYCFGLYFCCRQTVHYPPGMRTKPAHSRRRCRFRQYIRHLSGQLHAIVFTVMRRATRATSCDDAIPLAVFRIACLAVTGERKMNSRASSFGPVPYTLLSQSARWV